VNVPNYSTGLSFGYFKGKTMVSEYDEWAFHDNKLWGLHFDIDAEQSDLSLDIDYICDADRDAHTGLCSWTIAPATLQVKGVTGLQIQIDWKDPNYQMVSDLWIVRVTREKFDHQLVYLDRDYFKFTIELSPCGLICFGAYGYDLSLRKGPVQSSEMSLTAAMRNA